jgi:hypothetical protein
VNERSNCDKASLHIWLSDETSMSPTIFLIFDILAQKIVVPRFASLGMTLSQTDARSGPRRGGKNLEAALERFWEIASSRRRGAKKK